MKKITKLLFLPILIALFGAFTPLMGGNTVKAADAGSYTPRPGPGESGSLLFVNSSQGYFTDYNIAMYCFNNTDNAWSDSTDYSAPNCGYRLMIPYKDGVKKNWSKCIIVQYQKDMDPRESGWSGAALQTVDFPLSNLNYRGYNTITLGGLNDQGKITINEMYTTNTYYGIQGDTHMYLDLSAFTGWEDAYAKFAIYFACPNFNDERSWSLSNSQDGYYQTFLWKVNGQDNDHLYECIVPGGEKVIWNLVIAVRFNPNQGEPGWYDPNIWNKTQDLKFNSTNQNANMIHISDWNSGYIDADNVISQEDRVSFYGNYFIDTVKCSGSGDTDATTSDMWNAVKWEYKNHLSTTFQGDVWTAIGDEGGTPVQQAMARYDYIVLYKKYGHEDFINRKDSPNKTEYSSLVSPIENNIDQQQKVWPVAIVAFAIAMGGLSTLLIIKIRKNKRQ